jgi:hypothetical protein
MAMLGDRLDELLGHIVSPQITPDDDTFVQLELIFCRFRRGKPLSSQSRDS